MSAGRTLRALVNARLTAAAEDIFALFERTIAEFEEELRRSKQENQRKQELLNSVLIQRFDLARADVQIPSLSPGPDLNQGIPETLQTKEEPEEQRFKQEEEQLQVSVPESSMVCVKTEDSSVLQQRQTEHKQEETKGEDVHSELYFHKEHSSYNDKTLLPAEDWRALLGCSAAQMDTETGGDQCNQVQITARSTAAQTSGLFNDYKCAPETSVTLNYGNMSGLAEGTEEKKHQCPVCKKTFGCKRDLQRHIRVHTGEKPFSCLICKKEFARESSVAEHMKTHTGDKPYSCSICMKTFAHMCNLRVHMRTHTGETPFSCSICMKSFAQSSNLSQHMKTHTGETPFSCFICMKSFAQSSNLSQHMRTHTGETPFSCSICMKSFAQSSNLSQHMKTHTGETPFSCSICMKSFAQRSNLSQHMRTHIGENLNADPCVIHGLPPALI